MSYGQLPLHKIQIPQSHNQAEKIKTFFKKLNKSFHKSLNK